MRPFTPIRFALPALAVTAAILSGCGSDEPTTGSAGGPSGQVSSPSTTDGATDAQPGGSADVAFTTGMIPHHGQAIEMADMALSKADSAKVKDLAARIKAAQAPEIATLSGLLSAWGEPVPEASGHTDSMAGMDHGDGTMMTSEQMEELAAASGAAFDRMWVDLMIQHHQGAVRMSEDEVRDGTSREVQQLAQTIIDAQTREIAELQSLRTELS